MPKQPKGGIAIYDNGKVSSRSSSSLGKVGDDPREMVLWTELCPPKFIC